MLEEQKEINSRKQICFLFTASSLNDLFPFTASSLNELLSFSINLIDANNKQIEIGNNEKQVIISNFKIEVFIQLLEAVDQ